MRKREKPIKEQEEMAQAEPEVQVEALPAPEPEPEVEAPAEEAPGLALELEAAEVEESPIITSEVEIAQEAGTELPAEEMPEPIWEEKAFEPTAADLRETPRPVLVPEPPVVEVVRRGVGWGWLLFVGLLSAVAGAVLALAFLWLVNGTLDLRTASSRALQFETARLDGEIGALQANLDQTQGQVAAMQELAPRLDQAQADVQRLDQNLTATQTELKSATAAVTAEMEKVEKALATFGESLTALEKRAGAAEKLLAGMSRELDAMRQATQRFDAFLQGLRGLLDQTQGPTPAKFTPIPAVPATPGSMVTVIPLATPTP